MLTATAVRTVLLVGKENVGKSSLVRALAGRGAAVGNYPGTTVGVERYPTPEAVYLDAPGILRSSDAETTRATVAALADADAVLLVAQATHLDDDLADLLPLARGRTGAVAVTFWDKLTAADAAVLGRLAEEVGVPFVPLDARRPDPVAVRLLKTGLAGAAEFRGDRAATKAGWRVEPRRGVFERPRLGPAAALLLLLLPAVLAVYAANAFAGLVDPVVSDGLGPTADRLRALPQPAADLLAGRYGLVTMGPLLFVWAVPTVLLYAVILGAYKASGLIDRMTVALQPLVRPFGLTGRDLVRVVMGFGCNVPAVIGTRACSGCSRGTAVAAIAFGAACSYQFPATLAVFAAAGRPWLVVPFLLYLGLTTLVYLRLTAPRAARSRFNLVVLDGRTFLVWPRASAVWAEARGTVGSFFFQAMPIFVAITAVASLLDWLGALDAAAGAVAPAMAAFGLPPGAALPVVLSSVRKDGILLFAADDRATALSSIQVLTAVYLAGVLLPCLVTALTIAREMSPRFAARLLVRQAAAAVAFTALLAWGGRLLLG